MAELLSQVRVTADDWAGGREQINAILSRLLSGALVAGGLKLDTSRTSAPSAAPGPGDPNLAVATVGGVVKIFIYDGTSWVAVGTQL